MHDELNTSVKKAILFFGNNYFKLLFVLIIFYWNKNEQFLLKSCCKLFSFLE